MKEQMQNDLSHVCNLKIHNEEATKIQKQYNGGTDKHNIVGVWVIERRRDMSKLVMGMLLEVQSQETISHMVSKNNQRYNSTYYM